MFNHVTNIFYVYTHSHIAYSLDLILYIYLSWSPEEIFWLRHWASIAELFLHPHMQYAKI